MRIVDLRAQLNLHEVDVLLAPGEIEQRVEDTVRTIVDDVRRRGDAALCAHTRRFDEFDLTPQLMRVSAENIQAYAADADDELVEILERAARNIREFHEQQIEDSWEYYAGDGIRLGVRQTPIERTGIYIPG